MNVIKIAKIGMTVVIGITTFNVTTKSYAQNTGLLKLCQWVVEGGKGSGNAACPFKYKVVAGDCGAVGSMGAVQSSYPFVNGASDDLPSDQEWWNRTGGQTGWQCNMSGNPTQAKALCCFHGVDDTRDSNASPETQPADPSAILTPAIRDCVWSKNVEIEGDTVTATCNKNNKHVVSGGCFHADASKSLIQSTAFNYSYVDDGEVKYDVDLEGTSWLGTASGNGWLCEYRGSDRSPKTAMALCCGGS